MSTNTIAERLYNHVQGTMRKYYHTSRSNLSQVLDMLNTDFEQIGHLYLQDKCNAKVTLLDGEAQSGEQKWRRQQ